MVSAHRDQNPAVAGPERAQAQRQHLLNEKDGRA